MASALFLFHGELDELLPPDRRGRPLAYDCAENATVKHAVEAIGVPHTEIGDVRIDGRRAGLEHRIGDGETVDLLPASARAPDVLRFVADAHLGALARRLRLLGFDCVLVHDESDQAIAALAEREARVLLSRDRDLLKHRRVTRGRFIRATATDEQVREVLDAFALRDHARPFTRCLECNGELRAAARADVADRLPAAVAAAPHAFSRCAGCDRVYWTGSHWKRLAETAAELLGSVGPGT